VSDSSWRDQTITLSTPIVSSKGLTRLNDAELFVRCDCNECSSAPSCSCQEPSELVNENEQKVYAYTEDVGSLYLLQCHDVLETLITVSQRLFAFNVPPGVEVIECNIVSASSYILGMNPLLLLSSFVSVMYHRVRIALPSCPATSP
jgi:hypothetical protein